jgi:hypothetical protein
MEASMFSVDERSGMVAVVLGPKQYGCICNAVVIAHWNGIYNADKGHWELAPRVVKEAEMLCVALNALNLSEDQVKALVHTVKAIGFGQS